MMETFRIDLKAELNRVETLAIAEGRRPEVTATSLARQIGRDGSYLRQFLSGRKASIGAAEIAKVRSILGMTQGSVISGLGALQAKAISPREVELAPEAPALERIGGRRDVEELGVAVGGADGDFLLNGEVVSYVTRPLSLYGKDVFAVRVKGASMSPRYDEGDLLYVERKREPAPGEDGIFEMKPSDEWQAGQAFIKRLIAKATGIVVVRQFNPEMEFTYRRDEIARMYRVVPRNELLAV